MIKETKETNFSFGF